MVLADTNYMLNNILERCMMEVEKLLIVGRLNCDMYSQIEEEHLRFIQWSKDSHQSDCSMKRHLMTVRTLSFHAPSWVLTMGVWTDHRLACTSLHMWSTVFLYHDDLQPWLTRNQIPPAAWPTCLQHSLHCHMGFQDLAAETNAHPQDKDGITYIHDCFHRVPEMRISSFTYCHSS